ncbi:unnamed protein product [Caenorhabditis auriculariae]|uniref:Uncharacterized protein n=1 Tax=Caenorhabditis auriculariae TaxID=2777116 RepID=A0A8S1GSN0_9PELO|nr:unnamed protein product [Caenorhabditis auriculariae]
MRTPTFFLFTLAILAALLAYGDAQRRRPTSVGRAPIATRLRSPLTSSTRRNPLLLHRRRLPFAKSRRGPVGPSSVRRIVHVVHDGPPGQIPPPGIAKKLNEAIDFRALARKLLRRSRNI